MNIFREGAETIIDPMFLLANAPMTPTGDLIAHIIFVAIEVWAFVRVLRIVRDTE